MVDSLGCWAMVIVLSALTFLIERAKFQSRRKHPSSPSRRVGVRKAVLVLCSCSHSRYIARGERGGSGRGRMVVVSRI